MSLIRWIGLDPATIELTIKTLIIRLHPDSRPVDGRGGDGGRDVWWSAPEGLVIFEIKSFVERLGKVQRREIKNSLVTAAAHQPKRWVLIMPLDHSPAEETWFGGLAALYPEIEMEWRGLTWLNEQFAAHNDLRRLVESENHELLQRAREFGREREVIADIGDGLSRVRGLSDRMAELSSHWRADVFTSSDGIGVIINERSPGSGALDPLEISIGFSIPAHDPAGQQVLAQLQDVLDYGGQVDVDGQYVSSFDVASEHSKALFDTSAPTARLRMTSVTVQNAPNPLNYQLVVLAASGAVRARLPLQMGQPTIANRGARVIGGDASGLFEAVITADRGDLGGMTTCHLRTTGLGGKLAYAIRPGFEVFLRAADGDTIEVRINDEHRLPAGDVAAFLAEARRCAEFVLALEALQNYTGDVFPIPDELPAQHVQDVILGAQLLTGESVPGHGSGLRVPLAAESVGGFAEQFDDHRDGGMRIDLDGYTIGCGEHEITLGEVSITGPRLRLANADELREAAAAGLPAVARLECYDGERLYYQLVSLS